MTVLLERVSRVFRHLLWATSEKYQLTPLQIQLLVYLADRHELRQGVNQIAHEMAIAQSTVSDAVAVLCRKKLCRKVSLAEDKRTKSVVLTELGKVTARRIEHWNEEVRLALAPSEKSTKEGSLILLMELVDRLERTGIIAGARMCPTCRFLRRSGERQGSLYCRLLKRPLTPATLRVNCPEHEVRDSTAS